MEKPEQKLRSDPVMKRGTVIDAHVHPTVGPAEMQLQFKDYRQMSDMMFNLAKNLGDAPRLSLPCNMEHIVKQMDKYGVDKAIVLATMSWLNDSAIQLVREHGDRFPAVMVGLEIAPGFKGEDVAEKLEPYLGLAEVKGVGEWSLTVGSTTEDWPQLFAKYRPILDLIAGRKSPVLFHTGAAPFQENRALWFYNPVFIDDIAHEYPDIPIIIGHIGVQGYFYYGTYADMALLVAARNPNVYLETSSAPFEVIEKAVCDPAIGPEKLVFGSDTPAVYSYYKYRGEFYPSYGKAPPPFPTDHYQHDLANIERLNIPDQEKEMVLGSTIARILRL
jgi:predicted TIM-barrel fold metal-dependent hydrolase